MHPRMCIDLVLSRTVHHRAITDNQPDPGAALINCYTLTTGGSVRASFDRSSQNPILQGFRKNRWPENSIHKPLLSYSVLNRNKGLQHYWMADYARHVTVSPEIFHVAFRGKACQVKTRNVICTVVYFLWHTWRGSVMEGTFPIATRGYPGGVSDNRD